MLSYQEFKGSIEPQQEVIWSEIYQSNPDLIGVAKEKTAVKNLKKIVDATLELGNEKGFHAMSLRDLVAKAEISKGGLYAYIKNKDDLAQLIYKHGYLLAMRILTDSIQDISTPKARLHTLIRTHIYLSESMLPWFRFSYMEAKSLGEAGKQLVFESEFESDKLYADIIRAGQTQGEFRGVNPDLFAALIKAVIQDRYVKHWKYGKLEVDIEQFVDYLLDVVDTQLLA